MPEICKIECENGRHGMVPWTGNYYRCASCGKVYHYNAIRMMPYGEECMCGVVLVPVPWAMNRPFSLLPACEMCVEERVDDAVRVVTPPVDIVVLDEEYLPSFRNCMTVTLKIRKIETNTILWDKKIDVRDYFMERKLAEMRLSNIKRLMAKGVYR